MHVKYSTYLFLCYTCSNVLQFLSQTEELHVKPRILATNSLRFGALLPWFSHHLASLPKKKKQKKTKQELRKHRWRATAAASEATTGSHDTQSPLAVIHGHSQLPLAVHSCYRTAEPPQKFQNWVVQNGEGSTWNTRVVSMLIYHV
jgi:hypothetical protein